MDKIMKADSVPFVARLHIPIALEMSAKGCFIIEIAQKIGVHETVMSPSGLWHEYHEWRAVYPLIKQNCKAHMMMSVKNISEDPTATATMLNAKKWLASVAYGLSEKIEQSIEIEGNIHNAKSPIVLSFKDAKIKE
jgi:hypothetical protein